MAARVRAFDGGSGRKTDDTDAYAIAVAGLRGRNLELVQPDETAAVIKLLADRRQQLVEQRIMTVNRLHQLIQELLPGGASKRLTAKRARELLSTIRPRQSVAKTRKSMALEQLADLEQLDAKTKQMAGRIADALKEHPSHVQQIHGIAAVTTAIVLGEVGDVRRFPSKHHFASYTGTAPVDASSGDVVHHRLNQGGNRRLNFVLHVAANVQLATHHPEGYAYYQRKRADGKSHLEAMRCLKRRLSDVVFRALQADLAEREAADPVGHSGATLQSSASDPTPMVSPSDQSQPGPAKPDVTPRRRPSKVPA